MRVRSLTLEMMRMADEPKRDNPDKIGMLAQKDSGRIDKGASSRGIPVQWRKSRVDFPLAKAKGEGEALLNVLKGNPAPPAASPEEAEHTSGVAESP